MSIAQDPSDKELQAKLDELRAQRAKSAEARARRELLEKIEAEQRGLADDAAFEDLVEKYGSKIHRIDSDVGMVVVKSPHHVIYRKFHDQGDYNAAALEKLAKSCLVHPSKDEFDAMIEQRPALLVTVANVCVRLAGLKVEEASKK